jgi:hypothetical protein
MLCTHTVERVRWQHTWKRTQVVQPLSSHLEQTEWVLLPQGFSKSIILVDHQAKCWRQQESSHFLALSLFADKVQLQEVPTQAPLLEES